jgi:hypothetical protein
MSELLNNPDDESFFAVAPLLSTTIKIIFRLKLKKKNTVS